MRIKVLFNSKFPIKISLRISSASKRNHGKFYFSKRIIITTILITSHTLMIAPKMVRNTNIIIKVGILILFLVITIRLSSVPSWRTLFNMFNLGDQPIDIAHQLVKSPIDVGALVTNKPRKLILGHTLVEVQRGLSSCP